MAEKITLHDHTLERRIFLSRLIIGGAVATLLIGLLIARLIFLQVFEHEYYSTKSDNYRIHVQSIAPTRGLIYDRNGVLLAENIPSSNLMLVRENVVDVDETIDLLKYLIKLSDDDIEKFYTRLNRRRVPFSSVPVRIKLNEVEIARIAVNQFRLPGVTVEAQLVRHYPLGEAAVHAVGYLSSISEEELNIIDLVNYSGTHQIGKIGVEKVYEEVLHGQVGYETVEKNALGQIMKVLDRTDPIPGQDIVLHLDSALQQAAVKALGDKRGAIVALDPVTGGVLAMVSTPGFDPNLFVEGISQAEYSRLNDPIATPMFNRALAKYSPGSTVKPFLGLAGLDFGIRTRDYTISDPGYYRLDGDIRLYRDWTWSVNQSGHGQVNLQRAIYQSCDVYFWDLAVDMGIDRMHDFLFRFGFGRNTSVDIPSAGSGVLPSRQWKMETMGQPWYPGETLNSAIGQGYTEVTILQLATATMVLANKGRWVQPIMLKKLGLESENIVRESEIPDIQLENPDDWIFMAESMEMVVNRPYGDSYRTYGTAYPYIAGKKKMEYRMAGKSGTVQVVSMAADFDNNAEVPEQYRDHALFISFAPIDDPKIVLAVFVEHGEGGSAVAGPISREVIDSYLLRENGTVAQQIIADGN